MRTEFSDGAVVGTLVTSAVVLVFLWITDAVSADLKNVLPEILAVLATVAAAFLALSGVQRSLNSSSEARREERRCKLEAASATLPLVLSVLFDLCDGQIRALLSGKSVTSGSTLKVIDGDIMVTLKECIEYSDGATKNAIREIIIGLQVANDSMIQSDLHGAIDEVDLKFDKRFRYVCISKWLSLRVLIASLFDFSRTGRPLKDRPEVLESTLLGLELLDLDGWMLMNDPDFANFVHSRRRLGKVGFSDPNWFREDAV